MGGHQKMVGTRRVWAPEGDLGLLDTGGGVGDSWVNRMNFFILGGMNRVTNSKYCSNFLEKPGDQVQILYTPIAIGPI